MRTWAAAIVAAGMVTGCKYGPEVFQCTDNAACGAGGTCEISGTSGFCSFDDPTCPLLGRRYGDLSGTNAGKCVGQEQPSGDAGIDVLPPPDARVCFGTAPFTICLASAPKAPVVISSPMTIMTDDTSSSVCAATVSGGTGYCVVAATTIIIDATLSATGTKPLVLLASDSITANQLIDVGSHRADPEFIGAGADPIPTCMAGAPAGIRAGGAGGSFAGVGGRGGNGAGSGAGLGGQSASATTTFTTIRGGCRGQDGNGAGTGSGGHGGGAVYLIAGNRIDITGPGINAAGEGGGGGAPVSNVSSGAGGGGSGGMIGLDAPSIMCSSLILANGGGGGEGSGTVTAGVPGSNPTGIDAAQGGSTGSTIGGDGGDGSFSAAGGTGSNGANGTSSGSADGSGGGGGGGAGLIRALGNTIDLGTQVSPAVTP